MRRTRIKRTATRRHVVDIDPEDPSQQLDDSGQFHIEPLAVEVQPAAEASEAFDIASAEVFDTEPTIEILAPPERDTGELYGVRTPHAGDTSLTAPEDHDAFKGADTGETWLEALEERAAESGPVPEEEIVIIDDSDIAHPDHRGHSPSDLRDRPVADKGAGGAAGV